MVQVCMMERFLRIGHVWFAGKGETASQKVDICYYHGIESLHNPKNKHTVQYTLVSDLTETEGSLFSRIDKSSRKGILRGTKDNFIHTVYSSEELLNNRDLLESFSGVYNQMMASKKMTGAMDLDEALAYAGQNALLLATVSIGGRVLAYHSYVYDSNTARGLYSCSAFRDEEGSKDRNVYGEANRWLHWQDMCYFKRMGISTYDWGGIFSPDGANGIDRFKMAFGGEPRKYYNEIVLCSLRSRLIKPVVSQAKAIFRVNKDA